MSTRPAGPSPGGHLPARLRRPNGQRGRLTASLILTSTAVLTVTTAANTAGKELAVVVRTGSRLPGGNPLAAHPGRPRRNPSGLTTGPGGDRAAMKYRPYLSANSIVTSRHGTAAGTTPSPSGTPIPTVLAITVPTSLSATSLTATSLTATVPASTPTVATNGKTSTRPAVAAAGGVAIPSSMVRPPAAGTATDPLPGLAQRGTRLSRCLR